MISKKFLRELFLYGVIGGFSAAIDFFLFLLLHTQGGVNEFVANAFSIHAGITASFLLNRKYNFKKTDKTVFRAATFYLTGLFGLLLSQGTLWVGNLMEQQIEIVKFVSIFAVALIQFILNKCIAFGK